MPDEMPPKATENPVPGVAIDPYAHLLDPIADSAGGSIVEGAAMRSSRNVTEDTSIDDKRHAMNARIEAAAVREPLTSNQIEAKRGGKRPTLDQVDGINAARAMGKHLS